VSALLHHGHRNAVAHHSEKSGTAGIDLKTLESKLFLGLRIVLQSTAGFLSRFSAKILLGKEFFCVLLLTFCVLR